MRNIFILSVVLFLTTITFTSCAKKPYYDRVNKAADKAHNKLNND